MTELPITTVFIAFYAIALVPLTGWVGLLRGKLGAFRGHASNAVLEKRIRIHGNFTENAPAMALTLGASELLGAPEVFLWIAIFCFIVGRFLHFVLFDTKTRAVAMSVTQFPSAMLGIWCLCRVFVN